MANIVRFKWSYNHTLIADIKIAATRVYPVVAKTLASHFRRMEPAQANRGNMDFVNKIQQRMNTGRIFKFVASISIIQIDNNCTNMTYSQISQMCISYFLFDTGDYREHSVLRRSTNSLPI